MNERLNAEENTKSLRQKFFKYLLPSVAAMWVFSLYTIVDGIFVSRGVGPTALAAVNISMPFVNFIFSISLLFSTGASTVIAIYLGQGDLDEANRTFSLTIATTTILSIVILVLSLLNLEKIALFLGATETTLEHVKDYLRVIIMFNGFFIVSYSLEVIVKTDGFPKLAIIGVCISALMNILLDYIFVMKLHLGVPGAAYATGIAQVASCVFFLAHFLRKNSKLDFTKFKFDFSRIGRMLAIGFPDAITELSAGIVIFLFNQKILKYIGENGIVTYSIITYVNTLVLMTMVGITQGMQPLSSYYYGMKNDDVVEALLKMSLKTIAITSILSFAIITMFAPSIVGIFIAEQNLEIFDFSVKALRIFAISFLLVGYNVNISGFFASIEEPMYATIISIGRGLIIIAASLFVLTSLFGAKGIWISTAVSESICLVISVVTLRKSYVKAKEHKPLFVSNY